MMLPAREILSVFKLRIGVAISLSALAGVAMMPRSHLGAAELTVLALSVLLSAAAAGALNQYAERDLDAQMPRTRNRPFVNGTFRPGPLWLALIGLILALSVGLAGFVLNAWAAGYVLLGALVYGVVYTLWLKRRTWLNIVIGGLSGSFAVLAGAAAVDPALSPSAIILAVVLFFWTPPHFWSLAITLHDEYARARVPMLPVVMGDARAARVILYHTLCVVGTSLLPVFYGMGWIYFTGAALGGALFVTRSVQLVRDPGVDAARRNFFASLGQLAILLLAAIADSLIAG